MATAPARIVGPDEPTLDLINYCPGYIPRPYAYMKLNLGLLPRAKTSFQAKRAGLGDIPELVSFYLKSDFSQNAETRIPQFVRGGTVYLTRVEGRIVAAALTISETPELALVGYVYTKPTFRRCGLARATVLALIQELLTRRLGIYLYYDIHDPRTKNFYSKLGFYKVGNWVIARKNS